MIDALRVGAAEYPVIDVHGHSVDLNRRTRFFLCKAMHVAKQPTHIHSLT